MGRGWVIAAGTSALILTSTPSASAAADTTGPVLKVPTAAQFVVGTQIGDSTGLFDVHPWTDGITQRVSWSASDASGICGYDVFRIFAGQPPERVLTNSPQTSFTDTTTDYDDQQGGGSLKVRRWRVVAHDCVGNTTGASTTVLPVVTQGNDATYGFVGVTTTYAGTWSTPTCACWSGDYVRRTDAAGASATISRTWNAGDTMALVSDRAPGHGAFRVLVDGVPRATVDTFAATPVHRSIVWASRLGAGAHTVTLVNLATSGRPRVDLDAVLSNSEIYCPC